MGVAQAVHFDHLRTAKKTCGCFIPQILDFVGLLSAFSSFSPTVAQATAQGTTP
jgi:hypothetical protein